jgi:hypothetical protein
MLGGHKVYTGLGRISLLLVSVRLALPAPLLLDARGRGYKQTREGGRDHRSLTREWS